jgi:hypothetical protein
MSSTSCSTPVSAGATLVGIPQGNSEIGLEFLEHMVACCWFLGLLGGYVRYWNSDANMNTNTKCFSNRDREQTAAGQPGGQHECLTPIYLIYTTQSIRPYKRSSHRNITSTNRHVRPRLTNTFFLFLSGTRLGSRISGQWDLYHTARPRHHQTEMCSIVRLREGYRLDR